jgi:hypothetical protein
MCISDTLIFLSEVDFRDCRCLPYKLYLTASQSNGFIRQAMSLRIY